MLRIISLFLAGWMCLPVFAGTLDITISGGTEAATPIAVIPFGTAGGAQALPYNIGEIVAADLQRSGRFRTLDQKDMLAKPQRPEQVEFRDWRALGMDHLVIGEVSGGGDSYQVSFVLFDVYRGTQLLSYQFTFAGRNVRAAAHHVADMIYEKLTGEKGAFSTKVAYVTSMGSTAENRQVALQVADADGFGPQTIVASSEPLMSPAWSPDGRRIAYVSFEKGKPSIYVQELANGQRTKVASYPGINGAPAWSPDGTRLAMTLSKGGNPDIYILEVASGTLRQLTDHYAIDTEPAWSPDGSSLVFTSDRGGRQQIYRVSVGGGEPKRVTFEGQSNARASFSPDGKSLVLETQTGNGYGIGLLDLASGSLSLLTDGGYDETPSFAPNGRMIIYATKLGGKGELAAVSVDGRVKQRLQLQAGDVREPDWSPVMQ